MIDAKSLEPGEQLLWRGKPNLEAYCKRISARRWIGFGLLAIGAALAILYFEEVSNTQSNAISGALLLGGIIALCMPIRIWGEALRTGYALTDQRAIIERPSILLRNRVSVTFSEIRRIETRYAPFGDLVFRDFFQQTEQGLHNTRDGFFAIANVQSVERTLRSAIEKATGQSPPVTSI
jgi:hypothetical protein